jgi:hypothetical protein
MTPAVKFAILALALSTLCAAQEGLTVLATRGQKWPAAEARTIYLSACSVVQREFGANHTIAPQIRLVLGADKDEVGFDQREIRLTKWDRYLWAEGVVILAFEDLMPSKQRLAMAKRAVTWADVTLDVQQGGH